MKRLPFFTPSQRRALLVIEWVLLLGIIGLSFWQWKVPSGSPVKVEKREKVGKGAKGEKGAKEREWNGTPAKQFTYYEQETPVETFPFDPNTADSTALLRLGLSPWQVRSIYRYRAKHGRYHTPEDFMRVPNMTVEQWERLKDYIRIAKKFQYVEASASASPPASPLTPLRGEGNLRGKGNLRGEGSQTLNILPRDTFPRQVKLRVGQTIDINTADTSQLKLIPGIASKRAARIVAYRKTVGGFVSVEQAMEATELPDSVLKYMTVTSQPVQKINVNKLSVQQLMKHPYLNFYQAKAINEYRRDKGALHSMEELSRIEGFRPTDIDRLRPYVEF